MKFHRSAERGEKKKGQGHGVRSSPRKSLESNVGVGEGNEEGGGVEPRRRLRGPGRKTSRGNSRENRRKGKRGGGESRRRRAADAPARGDGKEKRNTGARGRQKGGRGRKEEEKKPTSTYVSHVVRNRRSSLTPAATAGTAPRTSGTRFEPRLKTHGVTSSDATRARRRFEVIYRGGCESK